jgi:SAM-dependent methyltransferase
LRGGDVRLARRVRGGQWPNCIWQSMQRSGFDSSQMWFAETSNPSRAGQDPVETSSPVIRAKRSAYEALREPLRRLGFGHARWPRTFAILDLIFDPRGTAASYDREFAGRADPWNYAGDPRELLRHRLAIEFLDRARGRRKFTRALEIGCAEGVFTELLAVRCESVLAVDFSQLALERASVRLKGIGWVAFAQWNLRTDPFPGSFDLIVVMDVLSGILRPGDSRAARSRLIAAMRRGDYLLVGDHRQAPEFENSWWGRALVRGGKWIVRGFTEHPALECVEHATTETHVLALLRKR